MIVVFFALLAIITIALFKVSTNGAALEFALRAAAIGPGNDDDTNALSPRNRESGFGPRFNGGKRFSNGPPASESYAAAAMNSGRTVRDTAKSVAR